MFSCVCPTSTSPSVPSRNDPSNVSYTEGSSSVAEGLSNAGVREDANKVEFAMKKSSSRELMPNTMPWEYDIFEPESAILPWEQDILLLDINRKILESTVSNVLGRPYLQPWVGPSQWPVEGKVFGINNRLMICMATSLESKKASQIQVLPMKIAVHYLVDSGVPTTFLCEDAIQALSPMKRFYYDEYTCIPVLIHGFSCQVHVSPAKSHFKDVCVIGSDVLTSMHAKLVVDYGGAKEFSLLKGPNPWWESTNEEI